MKAKAKKIDSGEVVEGYSTEVKHYTEDIFQHTPAGTYIFSECDVFDRVDPQTLEYSFNSTDWYTEAELKAILKHFSYLDYTEQEYIKEI